MATLYANAAGDVYENPPSSSRAVSLRRVPVPPPGTAIEPSRVPNFTMPNSSGVMPGGGAPPVGPQGVTSAMNNAARTAQTAAATTIEPKVGGIRGALSTPSPAIAAGAGITGALQGLATPTTNYYNRLGLDPNTAGENGFKDLAVRGVGVLSDVGANLLDVPMGVVNGVRQFAGAPPLQTFGEVLRANDGPATSTVAANAFGVSPGAQPVVRSPASAVTTPAPKADPNLVSRQGNSFSGNNIREGFRYEDGPGSRPSNGNMTVLNTSEGARQDQLELQRLQAERAEREKTFAVNQPGGGLSGFSGQPLAPRAEADNTSRMRDFMRAGMSARQASTAAAQEAALAEARRSSDQNASVQLAGISTGAETARRGQDIGASTSIRSQDLTFAANRANNRLAVMQAIRDQSNKDRDYNAGRSDQGFKERQEREQALQRNIEAQAPIDPATGKPDANYVRDVRSGFERSAARLGVNGPQDFSPRVEQQLLAAHSLLKTMRENAGLIPFWQPDKLKTIDPVDLTDLRVLPNGDRQITRKDSKAMGQVIPSRFFDTEGGNRIRMFGTPTNRYDILSEQGAGQ